jgi:hypothetical protein
VPATEVGADGAVAATVVVVVELVVVVVDVVVVVVVSGGGAVVVVVLDVVVVVELVVVDVVVVVDDVVVVDEVVVVGGNVVVVVVVVVVVDFTTTGFSVVVVGGKVVVVVVVGGNVVEVVVEGRLVGPKLASDSGPAFLTSTVDGSDNTTVSASFVTKRPCVGTNAASALYSGFLRSRSSIGDKPGLTSAVFNSAGKIIFVEFKSVCSLAALVVVFSLPSRATSLTCT